MACSRATAIPAPRSAWCESGHWGFNAPIDPVTKAIHGMPDALVSTAPNTQDQFGADVTLTGEFQMFGLRHEVAFGGDYTHFKSNRPTGFHQMSDGLVSNVLEFDPAMYADPRLSPAAIDIQSVSTSRQGGVFGTLKVHVGDSWSVIGGARVGSDRVTTDAVATFGGITQTFPTRSMGSSRVVTPYAGVIYDIGEHYSLYASYADIYTTIGAFERVDGRLLGPANGVNTEVGIKGAWRDGALNALLAIYRVHQYGIPVPDPAGRPDGAPFDCCYVPGKHVSRGVDVELAGSPTPGWLLGAGYSYNTNYAATGNELSDTTPKHQLKAWTSHRLPGVAHRWNVGGSLQAQTGIFRRGVACGTYSVTGICSNGLVNYKLMMPAYVALDLRAAYQVTPEWEAALTVSNVFDKVYYETAGSFGTGNWYAAPRAFLLRVDGRL
jgi:outer-membrane receptor for ferric coprogen and ferric-rhodotorulic acid